MLKRLMLSFLVFMLVSCVPANNNVVVKKKIDVLKKTDAIAEISLRLKQFVAEKYFDYKLKKIIKISFKKTNNTYDDQLFPQYIDDYIAREFESANQFEIVEMNDKNLDSIIEVHKIIGFDNGVKILMNVFDRKSRALLFTEDSTYQKDDFDLQRYSEYEETNSYRNNVLAANSKNRAYLIINAINVGSTYNEKSRDPTVSVTNTSNVHREGVATSQYSGEYSGEGSSSNDVSYTGSDNYSGSGGRSGRGNYSGSGDYSGDSNYSGDTSYSGDTQSTSTTSRKVDRYVGRSGYYPVKKKCSLDGKRLRINSDNMFYEGDIVAGRKKIIVSFKAGYFDAYTNQQTDKGKYEKEFYVDVPAGKHVVVDVYFISNGKRNMFDVKVQKTRRIKGKSQVGEHVERVEVF
ncbi:MAG: hypothetical protein U9R29_10925 [Thermodesulfobacteriota bacterium]|nr:hypothetical protein [Thermodesulfobacteriota bacterium]